jgi:hypothetical protein
MVSRPAASSRSAAQSSTIWSPIQLYSKLYFDLNKFAVGRKVATGMIVGAQESSTELLRAELA